MAGPLPDRRQALERTVLHLLEDHLSKSHFRKRGRWVAYTVLLQSFSCHSQVNSSSSILGMAIHDNIYEQLIDTGNSLGTLTDGTNSGSEDGKIA